MRKTERIEKSQQDMNTSIRRRSQSAHERNARKNDFLRICCQRIILGCIICILAFVVGIIIYQYGESSFVNTGKYFAFVVAAGSGGYLLKWAWEHNNIFKVKKFIIKTTASFITWCLVVVFISSSIICVFCYAKAESFEKNAEGNKENPHGQEKEEVKEEPKRNSESFVWENDLYIDNLLKYYTGDLAEEDRDKYVIELLKEDLSAQVGDWNGKGDESGYDKEIKIADEFYCRYLDSIKEKNDLEVQKTILEDSIKKREEAKENKKTALNQEMLGQAQEELVLIEKRMGNNEWYLGYEDVLKDYIVGLKCSIRENDDGKRVRLWEKIIKVYGEMEAIQNNGKSMSGILKELDIMNFHNWGIEEGDI